MQNASVAQKLRFVAGLPANPRHAGACSERAGDKRGRQYVSLLRPPRHPVLAGLCNANVNYSLPLRRGP
jgi:hypothetical protein